jgi:hypothetical protein
MVVIANQPPPKPIQGWISTFKVNHKGKKHGPYHYRCWKAGRRTYKEYIKPKDLDYYRAATQAYRDDRKSQVKANRECNNCINNFKLLWKVSDRLDKGEPIEQEHLDHIRKIEKHGPCVEGCPQLRKKRFMDPLLTNLFRECQAAGLAFAPILRAIQLQVPLEELDVDLRACSDPEVYEQQMKAVHITFLRRTLKGTQVSSCI